MPTFEITPLARKYAPWSFSKVEGAEVCPAQYGHKNIAKTKGSPATSDTKVGIAAHAILEHRVVGKSLGDARKIAFEQTPLTSKEHEDLRLLGENMDAFLRRFDGFCKAQGVTTILREEEWAFDDTWAKAPFFDNAKAYFRGKLDLGMLTRDRDLFFIDHKSGKVKKLDEDAPKKAQLQAYAVLAMANVPDLAGVRGGINFLQAESPADMLQWSDYIPADRVRQLYVGWLFGRINQAASNLAQPLEARPANSLIKRGERAGQPGWPCGWCQYTDFCSAFKEKFGGTKE